MKKISEVVFLYDFSDIRFDGTEVVAFYLLGLNAFDIGIKLVDLLLYNGIACRRNDGEQEFKADAFHVKR